MLQHTHGMAVDDTASERNKRTHGGNTDGHGGKKIKHENRRKQECCGAMALLGELYEQIALLDATTASVHLDMFLDNHMHSIHSCSILHKCNVCGTNHEACGIQTLHIMQIVMRYHFRSMHVESYNVDDNRHKITDMLQVCIHLFLQYDAASMLFMTGTNTVLSQDTAAYDNIRTLLEILLMWCVPSQDYKSDCIQNLSIEVLRRAVTMSFATSNRSNAMLYVCVFSNLAHTHRLEYTTYPLCVVVYFFVHSLAPILLLPKILDPYDQAVVQNTLDTLCLLGEYPQAGRSKLEDNSDMR